MYQLYATYYFILQPHSTHRPELEYLVTTKWDLTCKILFTVGAESISLFSEN